MAFNNPNSIGVRFDSVFAKFNYDSQRSFDLNVSDLKDIYTMPPMTDAELTQAMSKAVSQFSLSDYVRTADEQQACVKRQNQARNLIARDVVMTKQNLHRLKEELDPDIYSALGRRIPFLRTDDSAASHDFNKEFLKVCAAARDIRLKKGEVPDPAKVAAQKEASRKLTQLQFQEIEQLRQELGIKKPEDIRDLFLMSDQEMLNNYEKLMRYTGMISEVQYLHKSPDLSESQRAQIAPFHELAMDLHQVMRARFDLMSNPFYTKIDPMRLYEKTPSPLAMNESLEDMANEIDLGKSSAGFHPLVSFMESLQAYSGANGNSSLDRAAIDDPALKDAVIGSLNPRDDLYYFRTVVAHTQDGRDLVLTNSLNPKPMPVKEYTKHLTDLAVKADKWLLTGSKQFSDMITASKELSALENNDNATAAEKEAKTNNLVKAAEAYLKYKGINLKNPINCETTLCIGKNKREQSRLDVALTILKYARAQSATLTAVAEMEKEKAAKAASKQEEPKPEVKKQPQAEVNLTDALYKKDYLEEASSNMQRLMNQLGPERNKTAEEWAKEAAKAKKTVEEIQKTSSATTPIMDQDDFALLCTMACGSSQTYYKAQSVKRDTNGVIVHKGTPVTVTNKNPDVTYGNLMRAVLDQDLQFPNATIDAAKQETMHNKMLSAAQTLVHRAVKNGDFELLGQMLADGLKQNNKLLQTQRGMTPEFCAYATTGGKVLELMEKYPAIENAAMKHLNPADLQIAKAGKALNDMHTEGLEAQRWILSRFVQPDRGEKFIQDIEPRLAKVCQMYGVNRQLVGNQMDLTVCHYGKIPNFDQQINTALTGNEPMAGFLKNLATKDQMEMVAAVKNPEQMAKLYQQGIVDKLQANRQQNQPQLNLQVTQRQPEAMTSKNPGI